MMKHSRYSRIFDLYSFSMLLHHFSPIPILLNQMNNPITHPSIVYQMHRIQIYSVNIPQSLKSIANTVLTLTESTYNIVEKHVFLQGFYLLFVFCLIVQNKHQFYSHILYDVYVHIYLVSSCVSDATAIRHSVDSFYCHRLTINT